MIECQGHKMLDKIAQFEKITNSFSLNSNKH